MKMKLQTKLIGAFLILGGMVVIVGAIGKLSSDRLSQYVHNLSEDSLQSVHGLWQVNEGQTQIQSGERLLFDVNSTDAERQTALNQIKDAWVQIDDGFKRYEKTPSDTEEESLYKQMQQDWATWKKSHEEFMRLEDEFHQQNMRNPWKTEADLLRQGKNNSPAMAQVQKAIALRLRMKNEGSRVEEPLFNKADKEAAVLLDYNVKVAEQTKHKAEQEVAQTNVFVFLGVILGSSTALFFGIFFSITIAKPLAGKIAATVNAIVSSSSEIAATIEQQERTAQEQATAVNQTTTTMDELGASSRQSTEQAEASATGAQQVLALVDGRSQNGQSNHSSLREQVGEIADQILRLSEQTNQIGTISTLVGDLANQTNMLALNAAVEAVRAGEHGKGFGVVASEIRKLADQSKKSAERISTLVIDIQNATSSTVMATDEGTKAVSKIVDAINAIAVNSQQISLTAKQQAIAIQQVVAAMNAINQGASQTAAGISQTKVGTHKLNEAATQLKAIV